MAAEIPATSEIILQTDASKQFLDALLGQGWDTWPMFNICKIFMC
jgi:hypothetical protein